MVAKDIIVEYMLPFPGSRPQHRQLLMGSESVGILSGGGGGGSSSRSKDNSSPSPSFMVVFLTQASPPGPLVERDVHLCSGPGPTGGTSSRACTSAAPTYGGHDLSWWRIDAVVPYRRRFLLWVDYYRGMIVADMSPTTSSAGRNQPPAPPKLRYVPLPVDTLPGDPHVGDHGRGCPEASRSVCATRRGGVRFVSVDHQEMSTFGVGQMRRWTSTFRITAWSLDMHDGERTWREEARMEADELWAAIDPEGGRFPHDEPEFPVVDMENPDAVCFLLGRNELDLSEPAWMIEVDVKRKALIAAVACPVV